MTNKYFIYNRMFSIIDPDYFYGYNWICFFVLNSNGRLLSESVLKPEIQEINSEE